MILKGDVKFKGKLTRGLKNDIRNLVNFRASSWWKTTEELSLMTLKSDPNFEEKLTFCLKNYVTNLVNFNSSSGKPERLQFDGIFLSKVCNVWAKNIDTSCVVKNDLWCQKWHKKFDEFSQQLKVMLECI